MLVLGGQILGGRLGGGDRHHVATKADGTDKSWSRRCAGARDHWRIGPARWPRALKTEAFNAAHLYSANTSRLEHAARRSASAALSAMGGSGNPGPRATLWCVRASYCSTIEMSPTTALASSVGWPDGTIVTVCSGFSAPRACRFAVT